MLDDHDMLCFLFACIYACAVSGAQSRSSCLVFGFSTHCGVTKQQTNMFGTCPICGQPRFKSIQIFDSICVSDVFFWWKKKTNLPANNIISNLAVVKGWWSSMLPFFRRTLSQRFREKILHFCCQDGSLLAVGMDKGMLEVNHFPSLQPTFRERRVRRGGSMCVDQKKVLNQKIMGKPPKSSHV